MKHKYSIGLLFIILIVLFLTIFVLYHPKKDNERTMDEVPKTVASKQIQQNSDCYYLFEKNGFIVVYKNDKKTPFEYTDILYEELPKTIRDEIKNGKFIKNIQELYGFLENYTS